MKSLNGNSGVLYETPLYGYDNLNDRFDWHHYAFVFKNSNNNTDLDVTLYKDGIFVSTTTIALGAINTTFNNSNKYYIIYSKWSDDLELNNLTDYLLNNPINRIQQDKKPNSNRHI